MKGSLITFEGIPLHVTQICNFKCERRIFLTIKGILKGVEFEASESQFLLAGSIVHVVLQETFKFNFGLIEHYYTINGNDLKDAILTVFHERFKIWHKLFDIELSSAIWIDNPDIVDEVNKRCLNQFDNLADLATSLIKVEKNQLHSLVLGDEFHVSYKLKVGAFITGKIDLLVKTNNPKMYRIIELKTGENREDWHEIQLKLYGQLFAKSYPNYNYDLELWYPLVSNEKFSIGMEEVIDIGSTIEELINKSTTINSLEDLPDPGDPDGICRYSYSCNVCSHEWEIFDD